MPINLQNPENVSSGWPAPEHLSAAPIGPVLNAKLYQQELTQKALSEAIKNMQTQRQDAAYAQALQNAGLTQGQDISGLSAAQATALAKAIQEQTPDTEMDAYHKAAAAREQAMADAIKNGTYPGRGSGGLQRVWRQLPNGEWGQFTPGEAYKIDQQQMATQNYGKLSDQVSTEQAQADAIAKKWGGVDLQGTGGFVNRPSGGLFGGADPQKQAEYQKDLDEYNRHSLAADTAKKLQTNYEKWYRGQLQPGGNQPGGFPSDDEDGGTTSPPAVAPPAQPQTQPSPPPQAAVSPSPSASPGTQVAPDYGVKPQQVRQMAIAALAKAGQPQTEANIQAAIKQITGGQ